MKGSLEYLRNAAHTASSEQLQLMLIDGAVRFSLRGRDAIAAQDVEGAFNALDRAQRIVLQMSAGLCRDVNPAIVDPMIAVLQFVYRRLIDANVRRDLQAVDDALRILRDHREAWLALMEKVASVAAAAPAGGPPQPRPASDRPPLRLDG